jgi:hypothetical protein
MLPNWNALFPGRPDFTVMGGNASGPWLRSGEAEINPHEVEGNGRGSGMIPEVYHCGAQWVTHGIRYVF